LANFGRKDRPEIAVFGPGSVDTNTFDDLVLSTDVVPVFTPLSGFSSGEASASGDMSGGSGTTWRPFTLRRNIGGDVTQALVGAVLVETLRSLDLRWPEVSKAEHAANEEARRKLDAEPA
jgi:hypothetical protein